MKLMCHSQPFWKRYSFSGTWRSPTKVQWNSQKLWQDQRILKNKLMKKRRRCTQGLSLCYQTQEKLLKTGSAQEKRTKSAGTHPPCKNKSTSIMSSQCWNDSWMTAESSNTFKQNVQPFVSACVQDCIGHWPILFWTVVVQDRILQTQISFRFSSRHLEWWEFTTVKRLIDHPRITAEASNGDAKTWNRSTD